MQWQRGEFRVVDGADAVDVDVVAALLAATYWGERRPREVVERLVQHSLCFSLLHDRGQVGFARVATDFTAFSWLSDLVIAPAWRQRGLGSWLLECVLAHPSLAATQFVLQTTEAFGLYERHGFRRSEKLMSRPGPDRAAR